jgi:hypothetical protein
LIKKVVKFCLKNHAKNGVKIDLPWGGLKWSKTTNFDFGDPGPPFYKFFEISPLFAKTVQISTPKIDPINWPIENLIPHKNACTFAPMGV